MLSALTSLDSEGIAVDALVFAALLRVIHRIQAGELFFNHRFVERSRMSLLQLRTSTTTENGPSERLTAEEEKSMARAIRMAEQSAREAVAGIPEADTILMRRPDRAERTRAGAVDRLEEAVKVTMKAAKKEPELREYASQANRAWAEAEGLRWRLAMSGRRIAHGEARSRHRSGRRVRVRTHDDNC